MKLKKIVKEQDLRDLFAIHRGDEIYVDFETLGNEVKKLTLNILQNNGNKRKYITITSGYDEVKIHTEDRIETVVYHSRVKSFPQFMFSSSEQEDVANWETSILTTFNSNIVFERAETKTCDEKCIPMPCSSVQSENINWQ